MISVLIDQLHSIIDFYLNKELFENSSFYAERLLYEADSDEARLLLSKSYIGKFYLLVFYFYYISSQESKKFIFNYL